MTNSNKITYIGEVDFRNRSVTFGIKERDRTRHTYVIGKTGMGKSTLLENLAIQDMENGEGICFIDPHGSTAEKLLDFVPESRIKDVVYFAPFDDARPIGLNVLEKVEANKRHLVANGLMAAFKKLFKDQFSARMEYILNNIILALMENEGQSLLGVNRMLTDKDYRKFIVSNVTDPTVKDFWEKEYANYTDRFAQEAAPAIQNKVGQFVANPLIRNIIGQSHTSFNLREIMDQKKILIVNLSKGKVGESNANLIGSLLITKIYLAAMSRADAGPYELDKLPPFYFYVDEFQNFANESFASILSEARKYNLALTVAHQYVEQMTDEVKAAIFGNVGTMITFRVGATDAEVFEKEFAPYFVADDLVNLSFRQIYLRLMIDGAGSRPFSARTLDMAVKKEISHADAVIAYSRNTYGRSLVEVEDEIKNFYKSFAPEKKISKEGVTTLPIREEKKFDNIRKPAYESNKTYYPKEEYKRDKIIIKPEAKEESSVKNETSNKENIKPDVVAQGSRMKDEGLRNHTDIKQEPSTISPVTPKTEYVKSQSAPHPVSRLYSSDKTKSVIPDRETRKVLFDEKPATSLKDALNKALEEKKKESVIQQPVHIEKKTEEDNNSSQESIKTKKEIDEETLRKLVGDFKEE